MTNKTRKPSKQLSTPAEIQKEVENKAHNALSPSIGAAIIAQSFSVHGDVSIPELYVQLAGHCETVRGGNLGRAEFMLMAQAHSLEAIFTNMARRAALNAGEYIGACETYLKLALRAQSQCRATLETLATIKNPPHVAFVKQANIANGPQQVNNGVPSEPARVEEKQNPPTELLEHDHAQRVDTGTTSTASKGDPVMATVGTLDGAAHAARKGCSKP